MKKPGYIDKQMIQTMKDNSVRTIADATGFSKSTVHRTLKEDLETPQYAENIGDGCYTTSTTTGRLLEDNPVDYDTGLTNTDCKGNMTRIDSGYPDIYYNERTKRWEIWMGGKRIWRSSTLTKACEVRLKKGGLTDKERELLETIVKCPLELQEALNYPPI